MADRCPVDKDCQHYTTDSTCPHAIKCRDEEISRLGAALSHYDQVIRGLDETNERLKAALFLKSEEVGRLEGEIKAYEAGNVPVSQIISDNEGLANDLEQLQTENNRLKKIAVYFSNGALSPGTALPKEWALWLAEDSKLDFDTWLVEQALKGGD